MSKLLEYFRDDIKVDRTELNNLAKKYIEKVKELSFKYKEWAKSMGVIDWEKIQAKFSSSRMPE
jgi:hypothetical protein